MVHTTPRLVSISIKYVTNTYWDCTKTCSVSTKYVITDLDDVYSGTLSITVTVEC